MPAENYHDQQSFVILWVSWCENKCFWFTCNHHPVFNSSCPFGFFWGRFFQRFWFASTDIELHVLVVWSLNFSCWGSSHQELKVKEKILQFQKRLPMWNQHYFYSQFKTVKLVNEYNLQTSSSTNKRKMCLETKMKVWSKGQ